MHAKKQAANYQTEALVHVSYWLSKIYRFEYKQNRLYVLSVRMFFSQKSRVIPHSGVFVKGEKLKDVSDFLIFRSNFRFPTVISKSCQNGSQ